MYRILGRIRAVAGPKSGRISGRISKLQQLLSCLFSHTLIKSKVIWNVFSNCAFELYHCFRAKYVCFRADALCFADKTLRFGLGPHRYMTISVHVFRQIRNFDHFGTCTTSVRVSRVPRRYIPLRYIVLTTSVQPLRYNDTSVHYTPCTLREIGLQ